MTNHSYIITCSLPNKKSAEEVINAIQNEGIDTKDITVQENENDFPDHNVSSEQEYNVPLNFGAELSTQQSVSPGEVGLPAASLIMGTAFRTSREVLSRMVYFSMPVNDDTGGAVSFLLKKHHATDIRLLRQ